MGLKYALKQRRKNGTRVISRHRTKAAANKAKLKHRSRGLAKLIIAKI